MEHPAITPHFVLQYFQKWSNNMPSNENKSLFWNMLQGKCIAAGNTGNEMFCFNQTYNHKDLEKMLIIADDVLCDMQNL